MVDNTVFDSVFKTMMHKTPKLIIPFINEVFGRHYSNDAMVVRFSDEHEGVRGTNIDDSVFRLGDKIYHIECQSTTDSSMVVRMIEYDFAIALEQALAAGAPYEMDFPSSCVLFLRHNSSTPDALQIKVRLPDGASFLYHTRVVKAQEYDSDALFEKGLLLLLPYYLMRYEKYLDEIAADGDRSARLVEECVDLNARLAGVVIGRGDQLLYEQLVELIIRVSDHIMAKYEALQGKVRNAMGGEVLELLNERAARLEREARKQGIERGIEQGREQALQSLTDQLRERGVSEELLADAMTAVRKEREEAEESEKTEEA